MTMTPPIVAPEAWLVAREALLAREKAFTRERDALSAARRELPMVRVDKPYVFTGPDGERTLLSLFAGRRQLVIYHFMFNPQRTEGCRSCSFVADHLENTRVHLAARDTALVAVSRAPAATLAAFKARMGWTFPWLSAGEGDFNYDFGVSFSAEDVAAGEVPYNYTVQRFPHRDGPGISVFLRDGDAVFHTYSTYGRGLDLFMGTYNLLDLTPLGRQESAPDGPMSWLRYHDSYPAT